MTNADKYLKESVSTGEFVSKLEKYYSNYNDEKGYQGVQDLNEYIVIEFLNAEVQPTLTEDERVILRNLRYEKGAYEYTKIGRTDLDSEGNCDLILIDSDDESVWWGEYGHLFQFIKERRRI